MDRQFLQTHLPATKIGDGSRSPEMTKTGVDGFGGNLNCVYMFSGFCEATSKDGTVRKHDDAVQRTNPSVASLLMLLAQRCRFFLRARLQRRGAIWQVLRFPLRCAREHRSWLCIPSRTG